MTPDKGTAGTQSSSHLYRALKAPLGPAGLRFRLCRRDDQRPHLPFDRSFAEPSQHDLLDGFGASPRRDGSAALMGGAQQRTLHCDHRCIQGGNIGQALQTLVKLESLLDPMIAAILNRMGRRAAHGKNWNAACVCPLRNSHAIEVYRELVLGRSRHGACVA
jgi:hypothetical protein